MSQSLNNIESEEEPHIMDVVEEEEEPIMMDVVEGEEQDTMDVVEEPKTIINDFCISFLTHGSYALGKMYSADSFTIPENIQLVQYTLPGHVLELNNVNLIEKDGCQTKNEYHTYFLHKNGVITDSMSKKKIRKSGENITNMFLEFKNNSSNSKVPNMGFYFNNQVNTQNKDLTIPELTNKYDNRDTNLKDVLYDLNEYIIKTFGKNVIINVHQLSCHAGDYVNKKNITETTIDDVISNFENIDFTKFIPYDDTSIIINGDIILISDNKEKMQNMSAHLMELKKRQKSKDDLSKRKSSIKRPIGGKKTVGKKKSSQRKRKTRKQRRVRKSH